MTDKAPSKHVMCTDHGTEIAKNLCVLCASGLDRYKTLAPSIPRAALIDDISEAHKTWLNGPDCPFKPPPSLGDSILDTDFDARIRYQARCWDSWIGFRAGYLAAKGSK